jgi:hypothetical protein
MCDPIPPSSASFHSSYRVPDNSHLAALAQFSDTFRSRPIVSQWDWTARFHRFTDIASSSASYKLAPALQSALFLSSIPQDFGKRILGAIKAPDHIYGPYDSWIAPPRPSLVHKIGLDLLARTGSAHARRSKSPPLGCFFCSDPNHIISLCPSLVAYLAAGRCAQDIYGRVVLPDGAAVPGGLRGRDLRSRLDNYHRLWPDYQESTETSRTDCVLLDRDSPTSSQGFDETPQFQTDRVNSQRAEDFIGSKISVIVDTARVIAAQLNAERTALQTSCVREALVTAAVQNALDIITADAHLEARTQENLTRFAIPLARTIVSVVNDITLGSYDLADVQDTHLHWLARQHAVDAILEADQHLASSVSKDMAIGQPSEASVADNSESRFNNVSSPSPHTDKPYRDLHEDQLEYEAIYSSYSSGSAPFDTQPASCHNALPYDNKMHSSTPGVPVIAFDALILPLKPTVEPEDHDTFDLDVQHIVSNNTESIYNAALKIAAMLRAHPEYKRGLSADIVSSFATDIADAALSVVATDSDFRAGAHENHAPYVEPITQVVTNVAIKLADSQSALKQKISSYNKARLVHQQAVIALNFVASVNYGSAYNRSCNQGLTTQYFERPAALETKSNATLCTISKRLEPSVERALRKHALHLIHHNIPEMVNALHAFQTFSTSSRVKPDTVIKIASWMMRFAPVLALKACTLAVNIRSLANTTVSDISDDPVHAALVLTACDIMHTNTTLDLAASQFGHRSLDLALALALGTLSVGLKLRALYQSIENQGTTFDKPLAMQ